MALRLKVSKRIDVPRWLPILTSIGSVILAFLIGGLIFKFIGGKPLIALRFFYQAVFGSWAVFSDTMVKATPLIIVGLACAIAFKMRLWNIGAEGQFLCWRLRCEYCCADPHLTFRQPEICDNWNDDVDGNVVWRFLGIHSRISQS